MISTSATGDAYSLHCVTVGAEKYAHPRGYGKCIINLVPRFMLDPRLTLPLYLPTQWWSVCEALAAWWRRSQAGWSALEPERV